MRQVRLLPHVKTQAYILPEFAAFDWEVRMLRFISCLRN